MTLPEWISCKELFGWGEHSLNSSNSYESVFHKTRALSNVFPRNFAFSAGHLSAPVLTTWCQHSQRHENQHLHLLWTQRCWLVGWVGGARGDLNDEEKNNFTVGCACFSHPLPLVSF